MASNGTIYASNFLRRKLHTTAHRITQGCRSILYYFSTCMVTLAGFTLACILLGVPYLRNRLATYQNSDVISLGVAGTIGAMVVLASSLAVLPVERAVESLSPLVGRRYADDYRIKAMYTLLAFACLVSFFIPAIGLASSESLPLQLLLLAVALDLIRWHHRRVCRLLEPREAILVLLKATIRFIKRAQRRIARDAAVVRKDLPPGQKEPCPGNEQSMTESAFYLLYGGFRRRIERDCGEITEIAVKATTRHEVYTVQLCVEALANVVIEYLEARKDNIVLYPFDLFTVSSDVDRIVVPIYQDLLAIGAAGVRQQDESMCGHVVKAFRAAALHTANLGSSVFRDEYSAPLTSLPLGYLGQHVTQCQTAGLQEVAWQAIDELTFVSTKCRENIRISDVHLQVLRHIKDIASGALFGRQGHIANKAVKSMMEIAWHLLASKHFEAARFYRSVFAELESLVRLLTANESAFGVNDEFAPYSLGSDYSIGYVVSEAQTLIQSDTDKPWVNPYRDFMEVNEIIYRHLRTIVERFDLQHSRILWHISETTKRIAIVYRKVLEKDTVGNILHNRQFVTQVGWYESVLWSAFSGKKEVVPSAAEDACGTLAWIGMQFMDTDHKQIPETSIADIQSVIEFYCDSTQNPNADTIADLCICIWYVRLLAEHVGAKFIVTKADESITSVLGKLGAFSGDVGSALDLRKGRLMKKLGEYGGFVDPWDPIAYLRNATQTRETDEQDSGDVASE